MSAPEGELPAAAPAAREAPAVRRRQPPRDVVRRYPCPTCGADHQEPCLGRRGPRLRHHIARVELAVKLRYGQVLVLRPDAPVPSGLRRAITPDTDNAPFVVGGGCDTSAGSGWDTDVPF